MPWRLKFCQPLSGVFGAYTLRARHRDRFDVGFFIAPYHHRNPIRGPPKQQSVRKQRTSNKNNIRPHDIRGV